MSRPGPKYRNYILCGFLSTYNNQLLTEFVLIEKGVSVCHLNVSLYGIFVYASGHGLHWNLTQYN